MRVVHLPTPRPLSCALVAMVFIAFVARAALRPIREQGASASRVSDEQSDAESA
jgi:hypothetical protein